MKKVYLDNAATTKVDPEVFSVMKPFFADKFGNASEPHAWGQAARQAVDQAREQVASALGADPQEIIFTSCATESINLAHKGLVEALGKPEAHLITTATEHKAVLETCSHLEKTNQAKVTLLPVDQDGLLKLEDLKKAIRPETVLVSVMFVNNEVGTTQPIKEIGLMIKKINQSRDQVKKIYFHVDATQAIQYLPLNVSQLEIDLLSLTGHKIYAPKGIGVLYIRKGTPLVRQQDGGGQEYRLRAGTENIPYIAGLGQAIKQVTQNQTQVAQKVEQLRQKLIKGVLKIKGVKLIGHPTQRAPHIATFIVKGAEGEAMLLLLSDLGVAASTGSACTSGVLGPSHVLSAMGVPKNEAHGSLRFSLGKDNTSEEIDYVLKSLPKVINKLRAMAPKGV